jgi:hypothetical protein
MRHNHNRNKLCMFEMVLSKIKRKSFLLNHLLIQKKLEDLFRRNDTNTLLHLQL